MTSGNFAEFEKQFASERSPSSRQLRMELATSALMDTVQLYDHAKEVEMDHFFATSRRSVIVGGPYDAHVYLRFFAAQESVMPAQPEEDDGTTQLFDQVEKAELRLQAASEGIGAAYGLTQRQIRTAIRRSRKA